MKLIHAIVIALGIATAGIAIGIAQPTSPANVNGCVVTGAATVSIATGQLTVFTCNTAGQLRVTTTP